MKEKPEKKTKTKPFLNTKEKPSRDNTEKNIPYRCVIVKCVTLTHIPLRQEKKKETNEETFIIKTEKQNKLCAAVNKQFQIFFFSPFKNKFTFFSLSFFISTKCITFHTKHLYNIWITHKHTQIQIHRISTNQLQMINSKLYIIWWFGFFLLFEQQKKMKI